MDTPTHVDGVAVSCSSGCDSGYLDIKEGGAECLPAVDGLQELQHGLISRHLRLLVVGCRDTLETHTQKRTTHTQTDTSTNINADTCNERMHTHIVSHRHMHVHKHTHTHARTHAHNTKTDNAFNISPPCPRHTALVSWRRLKIY